jgi:predicted dehydrogenase
MHLAVLGTDPDILALIAAAESQGHQIVWLGDVRPDDAAPLAALAKGLPTASNDWETLLDEDTANAVLIGRGLATPDLRAEQLKRLATDAVPMLIVHPICDSVLTYYEVDMIRRETRGIVQDYNPIAVHPILVEVAAWVRDGHPDIGPIHQISCERVVGDTQRDSVLDAFACDAELLGNIAGDIRRATAMGPQFDAASYAALQVQMSTANPVSLRWSVVPRRGTTSAVDLTLVGELGQIKVHAPDISAGSSRQLWAIDVDTESAQQREDLPPFDAPSVAIRQLAAAVAEPDAEGRSTTSTWDRATQSMEVRDAIELSLQKGRTMEVHQQQLTEQLAFRGTMAAMGCGLLLVALGVLVVTGLVGNAFDLGFVGPWPIVVLAVLAFFLLLQALPLLIPKTRRNTGQEDSDSTPA